MSYKGSYLRGEKWYTLSRDADGNCTEKDPNKLKDINIYLEAVKAKEAEKKEVKETKSKGSK